VAPFGLGVPATGRDCGGVLNRWFLVDTVHTNVALRQVQMVLGPNLGSQSPIPHGCRIIACDPEVRGIVRAEPRLMSVLSLCFGVWYRGASSVLAISAPQVVWPGRHNTVGVVSLFML